MNTQPTIQAAEYEKTLTSILQTLPIERVEQVVDFARFIQWQELAQRGVLHEDETEEEVRAENERWDTTFAASRDKLRRLAREAREDIQAGRTMAMTFTEDDRIAPG
jgi:hypothetical protein